MSSTQSVRHQLSAFGTVRSQPASDWSGTFPLPLAMEQFFSEVGPVNLWIQSYGNPFHLPSLSKLWKFQAGYRWNGLTREPVADWRDDWVVVADQGGDPFIFSRSSGAILHDEHGRGVWRPSVMFPNLLSMAECLGLLGAVVAAAGDDFTDENSFIRPAWRDEATIGLGRILGSSFAAKGVLTTLGWE